MVPTTCRPGAKEAIDACRSAGVGIKMITRDNVFTAKAIATECGILEAGHQVSKEEVIEGKVFHNYTNEERMEKVDSINGRYVVLMCSDQSRLVYYNSNNHNMFKFSQANLCITELL